MMSVTTVSGAVPGFTSFHKDSVPRVIKALEFQGVKLYNEQIVAKLKMQIQLRNLDPKLIWITG